MNYEIFDGLNSLQLLDFEVHSFESQRDGSTDVLTIRGSRNFAYYHNAEIRFSGVEYCELPTRFSHAHFRAASIEETEALRRRVEFEGSVFSIVEERDSDFERVRVVVAAAVEVLLETVQYLR